MMNSEQNHEFQWINTLKRLIFRQKNNILTKSIMWKGSSYFAVLEIKCIQTWFCLDKLFTWSDLSYVRDYYRELMIYFGIIFKIGQVIYVPDPNYVPPVVPFSPPTSPQAKVQLPLTIINELNTLENNSTNNNHHSTVKADEHTTPSGQTNSGGFKIFKVNT